MLKQCKINFLCCLMKHLFFVLSLKDNIDSYFENTQFGRMYRLRVLLFKCAVLCPGAGPAVLLWPEQEAGRGVSGPRQEETFRRGRTRSRPAAWSLAAQRAAPAPWVCPFLHHKESGVPPVLDNEANIFLWCSRVAQPTGPCWFCLASPQVEKHLVFSIGTHVSSRSRLKKNAQIVFIPRFILDLMSNLYKRCD